MILTKRVVGKIDTLCFEKLPTILEAVIDGPLSDCIQIPTSIRRIFTKIEKVLGRRKVKISTTHYALPEPVHAVVAVIVTFRTMSEEGMSWMIQTFSNNLLQGISGLQFE